jgi:hypothetical protein
LVVVHFLFSVVADTKGGVVDWDQYLGGCGELLFHF